MKFSTCLFRTDATLATGAGHLMRCLAIATEARKIGINSLFVMSETSKNWLSIVEKSHFKIKLLPSSLSEAEDAQETLQILKEMKHENVLVVLDSYQLGTCWQNIIRETNQAVLVFDDMADRPVDCDYLLNWNPTGFTKKDYDSLVNQGAELLLGSKWFVFSPSIIAAKTQIRNRDTTIKNILISYGGSDPTCETEKALTAIKQLTHPNLALTVIFAGDKERANLIESDCHKSGFEFYSFTNKIAELTVMADLVLGSGGVSLMERLYLGTPTLVTKVSENQGPTINFLTQIGAIEYLGDSATVTPEVIKEKLQFYLSNSSRLDAQIQIGETLFSRNVEIHPLLQQITKLEQ